ASSGQQDELMGTYLSTSYNLGLPDGGEPLLSVCSNRDSIPSCLAAATSMCTRARNTSLCPSTLGRTKFLSGLRRAGATRISTRFALHDRPPLLLSSHATDQLQHDCLPVCFSRSRSMARDEQHHYGPDRRDEGADRILIPIPPEYAAEKPTPPRWLR